LAHPEQEKVRRPKKYRNITKFLIFRQGIFCAKILTIIPVLDMSRGELVPDELLITIIKDRLSKKDCENGFMLDGYPRTIPQADALQMILTESGEMIDAVLNISVDDEELIHRLSGRRMCTCGASYHVMLNPPARVDECNICKGKLYQRDDDKPETIRKRLTVYKNQTQPLINFYANKKILKTIDGSKDIPQIFEEIKEVLKEYDQKDNK
jgi:adenylate kinase